MTGIESGYHITRSRDLGLPIGTGKRYSEQDLNEFIEASPEIPENPFADMLREAAEKYRALQDELNVQKRRLAAVEIFERLLVDYVAEMMPEDLPSAEGREETKPHLRLLNVIIGRGSQQEVDFVKGLLGGTLLSKREVRSLYKKSSQSK